MSPQPMSDAEIADVWCDELGYDTKAAERIAIQRLIAARDAQWAAALAAPQPLPDIAQAVADERERCGYCDGTGDVTGFDGEWRGYCSCEAGQLLKSGDLQGNGG